MEWIQRLPKEIRAHIIPYTYQVQPKKLLQDIENYKETQEVLFGLYHHYWNDVQPSQDKHWLMNDIFAYANHYKPMMYGYVDHFYHLFKRNTQLQTMDTIHRYISNLEDKHVNTQINIVLGLFTVYERTDLVIDLSSKLELD